jgi:hypothetical protein
MKKMMTLLAVVGLVLALAPAAQAATTVTWIGPDGGDWDTDTNWDFGTKPASSGHYAKFSEAARPTSPFTMINANSVELVSVSGKPELHISNVLTLTGSKAQIELNESDPGALIKIIENGSLNGNIQLRGYKDRANSSTVEFAGGDWTSGDLASLGTGILKVSSTQGTINPVRILGSAQTGPAWRPFIEFVLESTGVAPIAFTGADPVQLTGSPYSLTVDMTSYTGAATSISLITFATGVTDTGRIFDLDPTYFTLTDPSGNYSVVQSDTGVSLVVPPPAGTVLIIR